MRKFPLFCQVPGVGGGSGGGVAPALQTMEPAKMSMRTTGEEDADPGKQDGDPDTLPKSQSYLDFLASLTGASISRDSQEMPQPSTPKGAHRSLGSAPSIHLPHMQYVNHFAVDIGGSLVKLVYFSHHGEDRDRKDGAEQGGSSDVIAGAGGRLHFVKFESRRLPQLFDFIESKRMHILEGAGTEGGGAKPIVKATGGGAYKHVEDFSSRLGLELEKVDEMESLVTGTNFLLSVIQDEGFTFWKGKKDYISIQNDSSDLFPYLLVNIGSGVSLLKVDGHNQYERVSGTSLGGGTFWGLGRLLTGCTSFDELLELSTRGDNSSVDMLVGDIYGGLDYEKIGLEATTIASSFGKILMNEDKSLEDYEPADMALALCRMISYNIAQIAYLNAKKYNLKRIFFGGFFIRGHPFTMQTLSYAINFWSKGEMRALFLRHEGFLGALGAFLMYEEGVSSNIIRTLSERRHSRANFVERFSIQAKHYSPPPQAQDSQVPPGPPQRAHSEKSWVEKFMQVGRLSAGLGGKDDPPSSPDYAAGVSEYDLWGAETNSLSSGLEVGVLHVDPSLYQFPLLEDPSSYEPSVIDISMDEEQRSYWIGVLERQIPSTSEKAMASLGETEEAKQKCDAFKWMFGSHLEKLRKEPQVYGKFGLSEILEMREECLRECGFKDVYLRQKKSENEAAIKVLPDLLAELDAMDEPTRLLSLIEGVLAGNIFDWGSQACVELYKNGTILDIYKQARSDLKSRPWRVDHFDAFRAKMLAHTAANRRYRRAIILVDNSGADIVLGMLPLARELLQRGTEVVIAANSLPALNDITAQELRQLAKQAGRVCQVIRGGLETANALYKKYRTMPQVQPVTPASPAYSPLYIIENGQGGPCLNMRRVSHDLAMAAEGADLVVLEGMGRAIHSNYTTDFACDTLKLAMVKNRMLAETLFNGEIYDCVMKFETMRGGLSAHPVTT